MESSINSKYGVSIDENRPKVKVNANYDLSTPEGRQLVKTVTKENLKIHAKTLRKLADM